MQQIELHCKACNIRLMDYLVTGNDEQIVLHNIIIKCNRCKRVMVLKKYTEAILRQHEKNGKFMI